MKDLPYKKWRDPLVLFLDDGFDCPEAFTALTAVGYSVQRFNEHFPGKDGRPREQGVPDSSVLKLCNKHGWVLVTLDKNIINTHSREVQQSVNLGILATSHNTTASITPWVKSLADLKGTIEKNSFKKRKRLWFGKFDRNGKFGSSVRFLGTESAQKAEG